jgi:acyl-CoA synthetase (NDP forming)
MENQKALEIIKALIDESVKKGVMLNIDTAVQVAEAFNTIVKELQKKPTNEAKID